VVFVDLRSNEVRGGIFLSRKDEQVNKGQPLKDEVLGFTETHPIGAQQIMMCYRGGISHGMHDETHVHSSDDVDLLSIVVPGIEHYFGLRNYGNRGTKTVMRSKWDWVLYEVTKYIGLLANGNPNALFSLWLDPDMYLFTTSAWDILVASRDIFTAKHVHRSFVGYASGQQKKMMQAQKYEGYMGERRKALVRKFGYDVKNAAHLIRLLRTGIGFLKTGHMQVSRVDIDADELLDIKAGRWSIDMVNDEAEKLYTLAHEAYDTSPLPEKPDMEKVNQLCVRILKQMFTA
jgi:hypothetical protein